MPSNKWLKSHYRRLPAAVRSVLINKLQKNNLKILNRLIKNYPKIYALHSSITQIHYKAGRKALAMRKWRENIKIFPNAANPYFQRGHWAMKAKNYDEAQKYLNLCLRRDKGYFRETAYFWRAEALFQLGRYESAKSLLDKVPDEYYETWFFDYKSRSKSDILRDIAEKYA